MNYMSVVERIGKMYDTLKGVYKPRYMALNAVLLVVYYYLYITLIKFQNYGVVIVSVPLYLLFLIVFTSSALLTIGVYSIANTRRNRAYVSASGVSAVAAVVSGVIAGCGCTAPILFGLTAIGLSTAETVALDNIVSNNQFLLFIIIILVNSSVILYYLNRLSDPSCRIKRLT